MKRSTDCFNLKRWRGLTMHHCLCSHLPVKGSGAQKTMAVALELALGTKEVMNSAGGHRFVYRQIYKGWNEIESGSLETSTY